MTQYFPFWKKTPHKMITSMELQYLQNPHNKIVVKNVFDTRKKNLEFEILTKIATQSISDDTKVVQALNFRV